MLWIILLLCVCLLLVWLWRKGTAPAVNQVESVERAASALRFLLQRGIDGGSVSFHGSESDRRAVVFTKYIVSPGHVGMRASCLQEEVPDARFDSLLRELQKRGVTYSVVGERDQRRVDVECRQDVAMGADIASLMLRYLFEAEFGKHSVAYFRDVAISDAPSITGARGKEFAE